MAIGGIGGGIGALDAAAAYGRAMKAASPASASASSPLDPTNSGIGGGLTGGTAGIVSPYGGSSFGTMVENMVSETGGALRNAEAQSVRQIGGKGDLIDVVTAIGAAETALDTVVAVRDRVVTAYSDIMRMQI